MKYSYFTLNILFRNEQSLTLILEIFPFQTLQQNKELKAKLQEIHTITDVSSIPSTGTPAGDNDEHTVSGLNLSFKIQFIYMDALSGIFLIDIKIPSLRN